MPHLDVELEDMNCIGIDVGATTGIAFRCSDKYAYEATYDGWCVSTVKFKDKDDLKDDLEWASVHHDNIVAIIEDSFLGVNPKTRASIDKKIGYIWALCEQLGYKVEIVNPMTWKHAMLPVNGYLPKGRKEQKALSILSAKGLGVDTTDHNIADAVCLAEYGNLNFGLLAKEV